MPDVVQTDLTDRLWSYFAGGIAGMGSAVGALAFADIPLMDIGVVAAMIAGTVAAAIAIPVAHRKTKHFRPVYGGLGFFTPPVMVIVLFYEQLQGAL